MNFKYAMPNVFMSADDTKAISNLGTDINKCINTTRASWIMNGFTDADWNQFQNDLQAYKLNDYLAIFQKYVDAAPDSVLCAD
jgi:putative aldouronate transport system substrate-binding protein